MRIAGAGALNTWGRQVLGGSQRLVPLDEGSLAESGHIVEADHRQPGKLRVEIRYSEVYAAAQHEGFALQRRGGKVIRWEVRKYKVAGRGKKYLEAPFKGLIPELQPTVDMAKRAVFRVSGR